MRTLTDTLRVLDAVDFPGLTFWLGHEGTCIRVECPEGSPWGSKDMPTWNGRWWKLSAHMTDGEIVQTAFLAVLTALEHEARERFTYKGHAVMDPHYDIDKLVELRASDGALKARESAPQRLFDTDGLTGDL